MDAFTDQFLAIYSTDMKKDVFIPYCSLDIWGDNPWHRLDYLRLGCIFNHMVWV